MPYLPAMSRFQHEDGPIKEILHRIASLQLGKGVPSYEIYDKQTNDYYECDLIVVTGFGVFVVELKHWTGKIHISPISWTVNATQHRPDPHKNNRFKAKLLTSGLLSPLFSNSSGRLVRVSGCFNPSRRRCH
jgi:hypothetical protein